MEFSRLESKFKYVSDCGPQAEGSWPDKVLYARFKNLDITLTKAKCQQRKKKEHHSRAFSAHLESPIHDRQPAKLGRPADGPSTSDCATTSTPKQHTHTTPLSGPRGQVLIAYGDRGVPRRYKLYTIRWGTQNHILRKTSTYLNVNRAPTFPDKVPDRRFEDKSSLTHANPTIPARHYRTNTNKSEQSDQELS